MGGKRHAWRDQLVADFHTGRANNGGTEAIQRDHRTTPPHRSGVRNLTNCRLRVILAARRLTHPNAPSRISTRPSTGRHCAARVAGWLLAWTSWRTCAPTRPASARFCRPSIPSTEVPSCPGWDAAELLWHLSEVQDFWGAIVRDRLDDPERAAELSRAADYAAQLAQFDACSTGLADALAAAPDDTVIWTWFPADQTAGFVRRRQAPRGVNPSTRCRTDGGAVTDLDSALATDGILEVLERMYAATPRLGQPCTGRADRPSRHHGYRRRMAGPDRALERTQPRHGQDVSGRADARRWWRPAHPPSRSAAPRVTWTRGSWNRPTLTEVMRDGDTSAFEAVIHDGDPVDAQTR